jgi:hypothetical protein
MVSTVLKHLWISSYNRLDSKPEKQLESYVREKVSKLSPNDHIVRANVTLYFGASKATTRYLL